MELLENLHEILFGYSVELNNKERCKCLSYLTEEKVMYQEGCSSKPNKKSKEALFSSANEIEQRKRYDDE